jgi:SAM-dependent methyltransferase
MLIETPGLGVGSSILDAGCGRGELASYLSYLGFKVTGYDESPEQVAAARRSTPGVDFFGGSSAAIPFSMNSFDLVVVRDLAAYSDSLLSRGSLRTTAQLLACVRPGGRLVFLEQHAVETSNNTDGHSADCYYRHLEGFPGEANVAVIGESPTDLASWKALLSHGRRAEHLVAAFGCSATCYSREDWLRFADSMAGRKTSDCCDWPETARRLLSHRAAA